MTGSLVGFSGNYSSYSHYRFENKIQAGQKMPREGVMSEYYRENPEQKETQELLVREGYSYLSSSGLDPERLLNMTMSDFKDAINDTVRRIPFHETRPYDEETVLISEEGWESMKRDSDYTAWVIGFLKEDRMVASPYTGKGDKGSYCVHEFGRSPEDYHGHGFSKIFGGTAAGARTMFKAESEDDGITAKGLLADRQPSKHYNLWQEMRRIGRWNREEIAGADIQARSQQRKSMYVASLYASGRTLSSMSANTHSFDRIIE